MDGGVVPGAVPRKCVGGHGMARQPGTCVRRGRRRLLSLALAHTLVEL